MESVNTMCLYKKGAPDFLQKLSTICDIKFKANNYKVLS